MTFKDFARALSAARVGAGLTQANLAQKANISRSYLCKIESGRSCPPSSEIIDRLETALGARLPRRAKNYEELSYSDRIIIDRAIAVAGVERIAELTKTHN